MLDPRRSVWKLRSDNEDREHLRVSLTHKKVNAGPKHPTFGLDVHFQPGRIAVAALDLAGEPALTSIASLGERAVLALQSGDLTNKALAAVLETSEAVAGARLWPSSRTTSTSPSGRSGSGTTAIAARSRRRRATGSARST